MKGGLNNDDGICMPYLLKGNFYGRPSHSVAYFFLMKIGEAVQKWTNSLHVFISPKLMVMVWGRMIFNMIYLVVYVP